MKLTVFFGLILGNFGYQYFGATTPNYSLAGLQAYYQGGALFCLFLCEKLRSKLDEI